MRGCRPDVRPLPNSVANGPAATIGPIPGITTGDCRQNLATQLPYQAVEDVAVDGLPMRVTPRRPSITVRRST
jgi:hypothetical protein